MSVSHINWRLSTKELARYKKKCLTELYPKLPHASWTTGTDDFIESEIMHMSSALSPTDLKRFKPSLIVSGNAQRCLSGSGTSLWNIHSATFSFSSALHLTSTLLNASPPALVLFLMRIFMSVTPIASQRCQSLRYQNGPGSNGVIVSHPLTSYTISQSPHGNKSFSSCPPFIVVLHTGSFGTIFSLLFLPCTLI